MPIRNWKLALNRFIIELEERLRGIYLTQAVTQKTLQALNTLVKFDSGYHLRQVIETP